jgi:hypothetical protein
LAIVVFVTVYAVARILDMLDHHPAAIGMLASTVTRANTTPVVEARVLGYRDRSETLRSERFWRSLGTNRGGSRNSDGTMRWSPRPKDRSDVSGAWDEGSDDGEESATYRTMCVRLCDGYYWPISFATTPEHFAHDAAVCERSCSSSARLFVYRNPGEQPEQMIDLQGRLYTRLANAFLYRTTYNAGCQCRPQPWAQASLDRHRMYALQAEQRKGNRAAAKELAALKATLEATRTHAGASGQRRAGMDSTDPIMRLGGQDSSPARNRRSRSSAANEDWMRHAFER